MKKYSGYETRALEVHDFVRIWDLDEVRRRLKFMVRNDMNALVLHDRDLADRYAAYVDHLAARYRDGAPPSAPEA